MSLTLMLVVLAIASTTSHTFPEDRTALEDAEKTVAEYVVSYKHQFEEHKVVTKDGYILTLWRIPKKADGKKRALGRPVLLQHGVLDNGFSFLFQEFHKNLPAMLVDQMGSDVWICHSRGTIRSLEHVDRDKYNWRDFTGRFWDFSWDEMGLYDIPAVLEYISGVSGYTNISYVCHSQGCTSLLVQASHNLELVNKRIHRVVWLAPGMFPSQRPSWIVRFLLDYTRSLDILEFFSIKNIMAHPAIMQLSKWAGRYIPGAWLWALNLLCGFTQEEHIDKKRIPVAAANQFGGSSLQNFQHWAQSIRDPVFRMHDFGEAENLKRYGQKLPPLYNTDPYKRFAFLSQVYSFGADGLVDPEGVLRFLAYLPSKSYTYEEIPDTNHLSGFWGDFCHRTLYPKIISFLRS